MASKINVHEAKTHFSKLLSRVGRGEEIIISKAGKPVARLVPIESRPLKRIPGTAKGKIKMSENFDSPLPESYLSLFEQ